MDDSKEMKVLRLVCISAVLLFLFVFMLIQILVDFHSGEIHGFSKRDSNTYDLDEDPSNFWFNSLAWFGTFAIFAFFGLKEIVKAIKDIKNS